MPEYYDDQRRSVPNQRYTIVEKPEDYKPGTFISIDNENLDFAIADLSGNAFKL